MQEAQVLDVHLAGFRAYPLSQRGKVSIQQRAEMDGIPAYKVLSRLGEDIPAQLKAAACFDKNPVRWYNYHR